MNYRHTCTNCSTEFETLPAPMRGEAGRDIGPRDSFKKRCPRCRKKHRIHRNDDYSVTVEEL